MSETTVNFDLKDAGYAEFADQTLTFRLITAGASAADDFVVLPGIVTATSGSDGTGSVNLFTNGDSDIESVYEVIFPNREKDKFIIPSGSATISLADLLVNHVPGGSSTQQSSVFADAIKRSNHTGTQPLSTISDNSTIQLKLSEGAFVDGDKSKLDAIEAGATTDQSADEIRVLVGSASNSNVFTDSEKTKLAGIVSGATGNQTATEIKSAYESNSDTNAFTDSEKTKLASVESGATGDQTAAEIKTAYESNSNTNAFTDADSTKLAGIAASATVDQTDAEIKVAYESNSNTNAFTDADHSKLDGIEASADVTDTTNVTAAGALMDSELTDEAAVKAIDQGLATTDDVEFNTLTIGQSSASLGYSIDLGTNTGFKGIGAGPQDFGYYVGNTSVWYAPAAGGMYISQPLTLNTDLAITEGGTGASTASAARTNLGFITDTATLDFPSISSNHSEELTMTVTGAATGDIVMLGAPSAIESDLTWCGYVSAADTVTVRLHNSSGGAVDPASATWKATVIN
jgi:hypothetical protein